jgi:hypothetical protein
MKPLFKCEIYFSSSRHLNQIYDGFERLRRMGIVDISLKNIDGKETRPLLKVRVNNKYTVIYDTFDGMNWIDASVEENLNYFQQNIKADFYFKRSYDQKLLEHAPDNCKIHPLGLFVNLKHELEYKKDFKKTIKDIFKKYSKKKPIRSNDLEFYPISWKEDKILFLTRLWDPDEVFLKHLKEERVLLNTNRINAVKACQKEFGKSFIGGLQHNTFTMNTAKDLIMPSSLTKKNTFINTIKESNICISTSGLHDSIGAKFGEYVAASRAIISEPLKYELPGTFQENKNYLVFHNEDEILTQIHSLLNNRDIIVNMMNNNFTYYNNYLRSDKLVLNTLLKVYDNI